MNPIPKRCLLDVLHRGCVYGRFLFTTDGFEMYGWLVNRYLVGACVHGQVIKKRKNRVTTVRRTLLCGTRKQLEDALLNSEDSSTLNGDSSSFQVLKDTDKEKPADIAQIISTTKQSAPKKSVSLGAGESDLIGSKVFSPQQNSQ